MEPQPSSRAVPSGTSRQSSQRICAIEQVPWRRGGGLRARIPQQGAALGRRKRRARHSRQTGDESIGRLAYLRETGQTPARHVVLSVGLSSPRGLYLLGPRRRLQERYASATWSRVAAARGEQGFGAALHLRRTERNVRHHRQGEQVPEGSRRLVRIMGQGKGEPRRRNDANVEVIDLREQLAKGRTQPRVMLREAFETGALAQLPPAIPARWRSARPAAGRGARKGVGRAPSRSCTDIVVQSLPIARHYLVSNLIPFTSKDIEKDSSAARELAQKASRFGIAADRVPILDVRGRLLVGYDETRMNGFLADW